MKLDPKDIQRVIELLKQAPLRIKKAINNVQSKQLHARTAEEPWSINDILIHLRACSDVWGDTIMNMLRDGNPSQRYQSPRAFMKKPKYQKPDFVSGLESYIQERQKLLKVLASLDQAGWLRPGTYTGVTSRHQHQTVWSLVNRILDHEQPHLDQIEQLLK